MIELVSEGRLHEYKHETAMGDKIKRDGLKKRERISLSNVKPRGTWNMLADRDDHKFTDVDGEQ